MDSMTRTTETGPPQNGSLVARPHSTPRTIQWLSESYQPSDGQCLPRCGVYLHYLTFCRDNNTSPVNAASLGKIIRQQFPAISTRRLGTRGQSRYHYYGLGPREASSCFDPVASVQSLPSLTAVLAKANLSSNSGDDLSTLYLQSPQQRTQPPQREMYNREVSRGRVLEHGSGHHQCPEVSSTTYQQTETQTCCTSCRNNQLGQSPWSCQSRDEIRGLFHNLQIPPQELATTCPSIHLNVPPSASPCPGTHFNVPRSASPCPGTHINVPQSASPCPGTHFNVPRSASPCLGTHFNVPQSASPCPGTHLNVPPSDGSQSPFCSHKYWQHKMASFVGYHGYVQVPLAMTSTSGNHAGKHEPSTDSPDSLKPHVTKTTQGQCVTGSRSRGMDLL